MTELLDEVELDPQRTFAVACGPPVFYKFVLEKLVASGLGKGPDLSESGAAHGVRCRQVRSLRRRLHLHLSARSGLQLLGRRQPAGADLRMNNRHSKPRVGIFGLTGCAGDQLQILNCEDRLLELARDLDIVDWVMVKSDNDHACTLDIAFVEGVVATERDLECLKEVRERSQTLVAIGTCAVWGGLPAMRNALSREALERQKRAGSVASIESR